MSLIDPAWEYYAPDPDIWGDLGEDGGHPAAVLDDALRAGAVSLRLPHAEATAGLCAGCQRPIRTRADHAGDAKYCSQACYHADRLARPRPSKAMVKACGVCGVEFRAARSAQKYCSPGCGAVGRRGPRGRST